METIWIDAGDISFGRIDAEFYKKEFVSHERFIKDLHSENRLNVKRIGDIAFLKTGPFGSKLPSTLYREKGVPLFRSQNVTPFFPNKKNLVFLDKTHLYHLATYKVI